LLVALVGRPNVGKSTLFNRLAQRRQAITEATAGVTRDRLYARVEWAGRTFTLVDTGGFVPEAASDLEEAVRRQAEAAMGEADLVLFVLDARTGATPQDEAVADRLRRARRPVLVVANKVDAPGVAPLAADLYRLGLGDPIAVSAEHGRGTGDLLDAIVDRLGPEAGPPPDEPAPEGLRVAVVGRPNAGKSSLVNAVLGQERQIVHDAPGTTRDAVDVETVVEGSPLVLVDTAGMRRRARVARGLEGLAVMRSLRAIDRADVVLLVVDVGAGVVEEDQRIAGYALDAGKAMAVALNKWDLRPPGADAEEAVRACRARLPFLAFAPVRTVSARTRLRLAALMRDVLAAGEAYHRHLPTAALNRVLEEAALSAPAPSVGGRALRIYYAAQVATAPPTVALFCNDPSLAQAAYLRYLENRLRERFPLAGTPLRLLPRPRRPVRRADRPAPSRA
jgi:GTP-binding protein